MGAKLLIGLVLLLVPALALGGCGGGISEDEYDAVVAERDAAQVQIQDLQSELGASEIQLMNLQTDLDAARLQLTTLQGELDATQAQLITFQTQNRTLQSELDAAQAQVTILQGLRSELEATKTQLTAAKEELQEVKDELQLYKDTGIEVYSGVQPQYAKSLSLAEPSQVVLANNSAASDPTWYQLQNFLFTDSTDKERYWLFSFACGAFADTAGT